MAMGLAALPVAAGQSVRKGMPARGESRNPATDKERPALSDGFAEREIDDPSTGRRWILRRNAIHPESPGRIVLLNGPETIASAATGDGLQQSKEPARDKPLQPVIHAGDAVVVEEHTPVVETRLVAVALSPAVRGGLFSVRLKIGGKVVRAQAVDRATAVFVAGAEAQP
jgi:hypothetical protein